MAIQFYLNGEIRREETLSPTTTVLDYLRDHLGLMGTKEGCAEGDCGACSIVLVRRDEDGEPVYEAVNSCLLMLPQMDGRTVVTVEGLAGEDGPLDPVQDAMVRTDGTQCGFCTPGIVMALYALRQGGENITDGVIHDALAGNLCRCTGYRPIVEAAREACGNASEDVHGGLNIIDASTAYQAGGQGFHAPTGVADLARLCAENPDAHLLAGGTDLGMLASKERQRLPTIIHTARVPELNRITETEDDIEFGAAVTYTRALPRIASLYPSFATLITRIGSRQIRNVGTIGGNVGNASPIGDTPPCLIALDTTLVLYSAAGERELPIEDFFLDYRKTDLRPGEFIKALRIPKLRDGQHFRTYKISKRYDQDISSVIGAYRVTLDGEKIVEIRTGFGGMAATPKRAAAVEATLDGQAWSEDALAAAAAAISRDFQPIDDHRASKDYRLRVAGNLLRRLYRDISGAEETLEVVAL
jgi:xanthine dehydrogenase small subunit